jgi:ribosome biogenesis GTPase
VLIDTPGMRELQLWGGGTGEGLGDVFAEVEEIAKSCRFRDCSHQSEPGCAVREQAAEDRLESFHKLQTPISAAGKIINPRTTVMVSGR